VSISGFIAFIEEVDFGGAVSRILSPALRRARIICLSSQYPRPAWFPRTGASRSEVSYLALLPMGFSVPRRFLFERWSLTPPFHPYRGLVSEAEAVCSLWHFPSECLEAFRPCVSRTSTFAKIRWLHGIALFGVRTFLPRSTEAAPRRFSAPPKSDGYNIRFLTACNCLRT